MQTRIQALILALALIGAGVPIQAQDDATTPAAAMPEAPAAEAPAAEPPDTEAAAPAAAPAEDAEKGKVSVDIDIDTDEDDGGDVVGRALGAGLAAILEEHVLTHDELSEEDREEVREAIAELRGEVQTETRKAAKEVTKELGNEIGKEIKDAVKEKRRVVVHSDDDGFGILQAIVAIVAIVFTLGMPIIIVSLIMYSSYRRRRLAHETITQYVSSGKEIPPEIMQNLFKDAGATSTPRTNLHKGSVNTGIGLGMVVGFSLIDVEFLAAIGFIFLLVGLAQLLIWKLEQGKKNGGDVTQG